MSNAGRGIDLRPRPPHSEPVRGVWLVREDDRVVVYIERADGEYYEAIREPIDGEFSHCISGYGIRALTEPAPWSRRNTPKLGPRPRAATITYPSGSCGEYLSED